MCTGLQAYEYLELEVLPLYLTNEGTNGYRMVNKLSPIIHKLRRTQTLAPRKTTSEALLVGGLLLDHFLTLLPCNQYPLEPLASSHPCTSVWGLSVMTEATCPH